MILYIKCQCGRYKLLARKYQEEGYEIRLINMNPEWRKEAKDYHAKLPFTVVNGQVTEI